LGLLLKNPWKNHDSEKQGENVERFKSNAQISDPSH
jgi:hypothetical protein